MFAGCVMARAAFFSISVPLQRFAHRLFLGRMTIGPNSLFVRSSSVFPNMVGRDDVTLSLRLSKGNCDAAELRPEHHNKQARHCSCNGPLKGFFLEEGEAAPRCDADHILSLSEFVGFNPAPVSRVRLRCSTFPRECPQPRRRIKRCKTVLLGGCRSRASSRATAPS